VYLLPITLAMPISNFSIWDTFCRIHC
jgi:hypothetical protein